MANRRKPTPRKPDRARMRRAARARARTRSDGKAARLAGETTCRALKGRLYSEWRKKYPEFREMEREEQERVMSGPEWEALNARIADQKQPERIETDGDGRITKVIYGGGKERELIGRARGKLKDSLGEPPSPGSALGAFLGTPPDKLAALAEAAAAVLRTAGERA